MKQFFWWFCLMIQVWNKQENTLNKFYIDSYFLRCRKWVTSFSPSIWLWKTEIRHFLLLFHYKNMKHVYLNFDILKKKKKESNVVLISPINPVNGGIIENYRNGGMIRVSRLMIFWLFSMLLYIKWPLKSDFPFTFDRQTKSTELWQLFCLKKLTQLKITWMVAWWGNPCLMIFWLFSMILYVKWPVESDFQFTFDHLTLFFNKKTAIISSILSGGEK